MSYSEYYYANFDNRIKIYFLLSTCLFKPLILIAINYFLYTLFNFLYIMNSFVIIINIIFLIFLINKL